jgi:HlyD family secretion protein
VWKWLLGIFLLFVILCGGGGYYFATSPQFKDMKSKFGGKAKLLEVRLEEAKKGDLIRTVSAPGSIEAKTDVKISAQVSAKIIALPSKEGDDVKKNDIVMRLDARDVTASLESAQAAEQTEVARLEGARADLERMQSEVERQRKLAQSRDISASSLQAVEAEYLRAQSSLNVTKHAIEIAQANIRRAQRDLENTTILSPIDGTITKLNVEVGEQVLGTFNNAGTVAMQIADMNVLVMKARVDESNIGPVKEGQHARVYINAYLDRIFKGTVTNVGLQRQVDKDGTGFFQVEIAVEIKPGERLKTGLTANTDIEVETLYDVVKVPSQAVVDRRVDEMPKATTESSTFIDKTKPFARVVYRLEDGKAVATPVSVGPSDLTQTVILGGLDAGQKIVTGPFKVLVDIKDGKEVVEQGTKTDKPEEKPKTDTVAATAK